MNDFEIEMGILREELKQIKEWKDKMGGIVKEAIKRKK
jgi:hypothetical protein